MKKSTQIKIGFIIGAYFLARILVSITFKI